MGLYNGDFTYGKPPWNELGAKDSKRLYFILCNLMIYSPSTSALEVLYLFLYGLPLPDQPRSHRHV
jgi:hypothetical protein